MRLKSSPRCESLRLPQQRQVWTREAAGQVMLGCLLSRCMNYPSVPGFYSWADWPSGTRPSGAPLLNWIPGDMNLVKNEARAQF